MTRQSNYPTDAIFKGMKALLTSLPSEEEKSELLQTLKDTRSFLEELELLVEAFPTIESSRGLSQGLSRLDVLSGQSERDTRLKRLMGFQVSPAGKTKVVNGTVDVGDRVRKLMDSLKNPGNSSFAQVLETSGEPLSVLTELATALGLRTRSKERKSDLIKRIATHIENQRGYSILRGANPDAVFDVATLAS